MPATYEPIATTTLGSSASSISFTSIPSTYTDLVVIGVGTSSDGSNHGLQFNNDTAFNYSTTMFGGNGSSTFTERKTTSSGDGGRRAFVWTSNGSTNQFNFIAHVMNYSNSTTNKSIIARYNQAGSYVWTTVGLWQSTSAINRVDLIPHTGTFSSGFTATIYGIKAA